MLHALGKRAVLGNVEVSEDGWRSLLARCVYSFLGARRHGRGKTADKAAFCSHSCIGPDRENEMLIMLICSLFMLPYPLIIAHAPLVFRACTAPSEVPSLDIPFPLLMCLFVASPPAEV